MQLVFVAVVATFILAYGQTSGDQAGTVAMVNGVPIRPTDYSRELRIEEGQAGSLDEAGRERLKEQVRARMIRSEVSLQEAESLGLQVSSREIAQSLLDTPYFSEEGRFSEKRYEAIIRQQGFTRAEYEDRVRKSLLRSKLDMLLWMGTSVSEPEVKAAYVNDATRIDLEYVRVRPSLFQDDLSFTDEEVVTWLGDNEARVKETYDRDFDRLYDVPDKFHARLLRFEIREDGVEVAALEERMKGLLAELEAGGDFDAIARRWSEDPSAAEGGDLGLLTEAQLGGKVVSALTGLEVGAYSKVLADERQVRLYRFEAKEPAHVISIDDVRNDIARAIMVEDAAPAEAAAFAEKLLGSWDGDAAARAELLDSQELTVLTTGPIPLSGDSVIGGVPAPILGAARDLAAGDALPEVQEIGGVYWVGAVRSRTEADMTRYETEQENVREQVLFGKRREFREMWLDAAVADANVR